MASITQEEAANLAALGKPVPPEFGRCNSLNNPLGKAPARAFVLMTRKSLLALDLDANQTLTMGDAIGNAVRAYGLVVCKEPIALLTPANTANDPQESCLVELADAGRWLAANPNFRVPVNKQYNVRAPAYGLAPLPPAWATWQTYAADTMQHGLIPWTWLAMVQDLWLLLAGQLGAPPATLPANPGGTPEGWIFPGVSAWEALCQVLDRLGCAVRWNPTAAAGQYTIVQVGAPDTQAALLLGRVERQNRKIHDTEALGITRGKLPAGARVHFHRVDLCHGTEEVVTNLAGSAWQPKSVFTVDVPAPYPDTEPGTLTPVWDDLPALVDTGSPGNLTNLPAMQTRAQERAADLFRTLLSVGPRSRKIYSGLVAIAPGSTLQGVSWRQDGEGAWVTETVRFVAHVNECGEWEECGASQVQPPWFGPGQPLYPPATAVVKIVIGNGHGQLPAAALFDGVLEKSIRNTGDAIRPWPRSGAGLGREHERGQRCAARCQDATAKRLLTGWHAMPRRASAGLRVPSWLAKPAPLWGAADGDPGDGRRSGRHILSYPLETP